jgi:hypothetical protein
MFTDIQVQALWFLLVFMGIPLLGALLSDVVEKLYKFFRRGIFWR